MNQSMKFIRRHVIAAIVVSTVALVGVAGSAVAFSGITTSSAQVKTLSFIGGSSTPTRTLLSVDGLTIKVSCDASTRPVITATTSAAHADLLGHIIDGGGAVHPIMDDAFTTTSSDDLTAGVTAADGDASGMVAYERAGGGVVTVNYAFDNTPTLNGLATCTVYGTAALSGDR